MAIASPSAYQTLANAPQGNVEELEREKKELEALACRWKVALKTTSCICLPLSLLWRCVNLCPVGCSAACDYTDKRDNIRVCNWTTCDGGTIWHPALPPQDWEERCRLGCDPCVCCICRTRDTVEHYLLPPERQRMNAILGQTEVPREQNYRRDPFPHYERPPHGQRRQDYDAFGRP